jgi:hypothetical protein
MESDPRLLREYIRDRNSKSKLERWNVAIVGNPKSVVGEFPFDDELAVAKVIRARIEGTPDRTADIKTLMSRRDAALDLDVDGGTLTEADIKRLRRTQLPDSGLLVLYPIDAESPTKRESREPLNAATDVIGIGLVFPEPPPNEDSEVYFAADLSRVRKEAGYVEEEDLTALEEE